jgi:hypothetical protein
LWKEGSDTQNGGRPELGGNAMNTHTHKYIYIYYAYTG